MPTPSAASLDDTDASVTDLSEVGDSYTGVPEEYARLLREKDEELAVLRAEVEDITMQLMELQPSTPVPTTPFTPNSPGLSTTHSQVNVWQTRGAADASCTSLALSAASRAPQRVREAVALLREEVAYFRDACESAEARVEELEEELEKVRGAGAAAHVPHEDIGALKAELASVKEENADLTAMLGDGDDKEERIELLEGEVASLEAALAAARTRTNSIPPAGANDADTAVLQSAQRRIAALERQLALQVAAAQKESGTVEALRKEVVRLQGEAGTGTGTPVSTPAAVPAPTPAIPQRWRQSSAGLPPTPPSPRTVDDDGAGLPKLVRSASMPPCGSVPSNTNGSNGTAHAPDDSARRLTAMQKLLDGTARAKEALEAQVARMAAELDALKGVPADGAGGAAAPENPTVADRPEGEGTGVAGVPNGHGGREGGADDGVTLARRVVALEKLVARYADDLAARDAAITRLEAVAAEHAQCRTSWASAAVPVASAAGESRAEGAARAASRATAPTTTTADNSALEAEIVRLQNVIHAKDVEYRELVHEHSRCGAGKHAAAAAGAKPPPPPPWVRARATKEERETTEESPVVTVDVEVDDPDDTASDMSDTSAASLETPWHIRQRRAMESKPEIDENDDLEALVASLQRENFTMKALLAAADAEAGNGDSEEQAKRIAVLEGRLTKVEADAALQQQKLAAATERVRALQRDLARLEAREGAPDNAEKAELEAALRDAILAEKHAERDACALSERIQEMRQAVAGVREVQQRVEKQQASPFAAPATAAARYKGATPAAAREAALHKRNLVLQQRVAELETAAARREGMPLATRRVSSGTRGTWNSPFGSPVASPRHAQQRQAAEAATVADLREELDTQEKNAKHDRALAVSLRVQLDDAARAAQSQTAELRRKIRAYDDLRRDFTDMQARYTKMLAVLEGPGVAPAPAPAPTPTRRRSTKLSM